MSQTRSNLKIQPHHLDRQAFVYIRQSTLQQVQNHQESTQLQYNLVYYARDLGWPEDRVQVIDEDLGKSAAGIADRQGFQRLVTEVTLDHVGLVLGIEMSRLARSSRDWHQLLEVCALFGTLIADQDGIYDPQNFNDRLLLGLKGTMSEAELHVIKQRMVQGRLNKARRGELRTHLPIGYYLLKGQVVLDPDEQVQHMVRLVFRKFREIGTLSGVLKYLVYHDLQMPVRRIGKKNDQELTWQRPNRMTLVNLLHHPIYAGAYSYGRKKLDPRKQKAGRPHTGQVVQERSNWHAFIPDHFPSYITWDEYLHHQEQLHENQMRRFTKGAPRMGSALLSGLVFCGKCGQRMQTHYSRPRFSYGCSRLHMDYAEPVCQFCVGQPVDRWVVEQVLEALKPASLEVSLATLQHLEQDRKDLEKLWRQRLERAHFEAERCRRQYVLVEPENRLVARTLEKEWEEKLAAEQKLKEEYHRFQSEQPRVLSPEDLQRIRDLSQDIPQLWFAPTTTDLERKAILRQVVQKVIVEVQEKSERVRVEIQWMGGMVTSGTVTKPVAKLEQLSYYPELMRLVKSHVEQGTLIKDLVRVLNETDFRPPKRIQVWNVAAVQGLVRRMQKAKGEQDSLSVPLDHWWRLRDLASWLGMPGVTLHRWVTMEQVQAKRNEKGKWLVWADETEVLRLRKIRQTPRSEINRNKWLEQFASKKPSG